MFSLRTWAVCAVILVLTALPIWALSNANGAIQGQSWLLLAIAYVLVVLTIATIRIYIRLGELIEAIAGQRVHVEEQLERPNLPPPAYGPPSVYAPHPEYDPPPPAVGRRPNR